MIEGEGGPELEAFLGETAEAASEVANTGGEAVGSVVEEVGKGIGEDTEKAATPETTEVQAQPQYEGNLTGDSFEADPEK